MAPPDRSDPGDRFEQLSDDSTGAVPTSEAVTAALPGVVGLGDTAAEFSRMIDIGDRYLGLATAGLGQKLQVAHAREEYTPLGIDCVAMTVNELVAAGLTPVCYVNHLTVAEPEEAVATAIAQGIAEAAEQAGILLLGGEMSVDPDAVTRFDVVGTAAGVADQMGAFPGEAATGDHLVGYPSTGLHPVEVASARAALDAEDLTTEYPGDGYETVAEALGVPLRLYASLTEPLAGVDVHAAVALTGGWTDLESLGDNRYVISEPPDPPEVFDVIESAGGHSVAEMYRTYSMGTGMVVAAPESAAKRLVAGTDGELVGVVERGSGVEVRGVALDSEDET